MLDIVQCLQVQNVLSLCQAFTKSATVERYSSMIFMTVSLPPKVFCLLVVIALQVKTSLPSSQNTCHSSTAHLHIFACAPFPVSFIFLGYLVSAQMSFISWRLPWSPQSILITYSLCIPTALYFTCPIRYHNLNRVLLCTCLYFLVNSYRISVCVTLFLVKDFTQKMLFNSSTPWTVDCQDSLSMEFSRQIKQSGLLFPPPGDLPDPGIEPRSFRSPALEGVFFTTSATWEAPINANWVEF